MVSHRFAEILRDEVPAALLLLADPSAENVSTYADRAIFLALRESETGRVIACAALIELEPAEIEVKNFAVSPECQMQGLGRQLFTQIVCFARARGAERITVGTGNSSLGPLAFYQKLGFRITAVWRDHFRSYRPPIVENGIACRDMIRLSYEVDNPATS